MVEGVPPIETVGSKYTLHNKLGAGSFGQIYLGAHTLVLVSIEYVVLSCAPVHRPRTIISGQFQSGAVGQRAGTRPAGCRLAELLSQPHPAFCVFRCKRVPSRSSVPCSSASMPCLAASRDGPRLAACIFRGKTDNPR